MYGLFHLSVLDLVRGVAGPWRRESDISRSAAFAHRAGAEPGTPSLCGRQQHYHRDVPYESKWIAFGHRRAVLAGWSAPGDDATSRALLPQVADAPHAELLEVLSDGSAMAEDVPKCSAVVR